MASVYRLHMPARLLDDITTASEHSDWVVRAVPIVDIRRSAETTTSIYDSYEYGVPVDELPVPWPCAITSSTSSNLVFVSFLDILRYFHASTHTAASISAGTLPDFHTTQHALAFLTTLRSIQNAIQHYPRVFSIKQSLLGSVSASPREVEDVKLPEHVRIPFDEDELYSGLRNHIRPRARVEVLTGSEASTSCPTHLSGRTIEAVMGLKLNVARLVVELPMQALEGMVLNDAPAPRMTVEHEDMFLVRWKGCSSSHDSWEYVSDLMALDASEIFAVAVSEYAQSSRTTFLQDGAAGAHYHHHQVRLTTTSPALSLKEYVDSTTMSTVSSVKNLGLSIDTTTPNVAASSDEGAVVRTKKSVSIMGITLNVESEDYTANNITVQNEGGESFSILSPQLVPAARNPATPGISSITCNDEWVLRIQRAADEGDKNCITWVIFADVTNLFCGSQYLQKHGLRHTLYSTFGAKWQQFWSKDGLECWKSSKSPNLGVDGGVFLATIREMTLDDVFSVGRPAKIFLVADGDSEKVFDSWEQQWGAVVGGDLMEKLRIPWPNASQRSSTISYEVAASEAEFVTQTNKIIPFISKLLGSHAMKQFNSLLRAAQLSAVQGNCAPYNALVRFINALQSAVSASLTVINDLTTPIHAFETEAAHGFGCLSAVRLTSNTTINLDIPYTGKLRLRAVGVDGDVVASGDEDADGSSSKAEEITRYEIVAPGYNTTQIKSALSALSTFIPHTECHEITKDLADLLFDRRMRCLLDGIHANCSPTDSVVCFSTSSKVLSQLQMWFLRERGRMEAANCVAFEDNGLHYRIHLCDAPSQWNSLSNPVVFDVGQPFPSSIFTRGTAELHTESNAAARFIQLCNINVGEGGTLTPPEHVAETVDGLLENIAEAIAALKPADTIFPDYNTLLREVQFSDFFPTLSSSSSTSDGGAEPMIRTRNKHPETPEIEAHYDPSLLFSVLNSVSAWRKLHMQAVSAYEGVEKNLRELWVECQQMFPTRLNDLPEDVLQQCRSAIKHYTVVCDALNVPKSHRITPLQVIAAVATDIERVKKTGANSTGSTPTPISSAGDIFNRLDRIINAGEECLERCNSLQLHKSAASEFSLYNTFERLTLQTADAIAEIHPSIFVSDALRLFACCLPSFTPESLLRVAEGAARDLWISFITTFTQLEPSALHHTINPVANVLLPTSSSSSSSPDSAICVRCGDSGALVSCGVCASFIHPTCGNLLQAPFTHSNCGCYRESVSACFLCGDADAYLVSCAVEGCTTAFHYACAFHNANFTPIATINGENKQTWQILRCPKHICRACGSAGVSGHVQPWISTVFESVRNLLTDTNIIAEHMKEAGFPLNARGETQMKLFRSKALQQCQSSLPGELIHCLDCNFGFHFDCLTHPQQHSVRNGTIRCVHHVGLGDGSASAAAGHKGVASKEAKQEEIPAVYEEGKVSEIKPQQIHLALGSAVFTTLTGMPTIGFSSLSAPLQAQVQTLYSVLVANVMESLAQNGAPNTLIAAVYAAYTLGASGTALPNIGTMGSGKTDETVDKAGTKLLQKAVVGSPAITSGMRMAGTAAHTPAATAAVAVNVELVPDAVDEMQEISHLPSELLSEWLEDWDDATPASTLQNNWKTDATATLSCAVLKVKKERADSGRVTRRGHVNAAFIKCDLCRRAGESHGNTDANAADVLVTGPFFRHPLTVKAEKAGQTNRSIWVHALCAALTPETFCDTEGNVYNVVAAVKRGRFIRCKQCNGSGATIGCYVPKCPFSFHLPCAVESGWDFHACRDFFCPKHRDTTTMNSLRRLDTARTKRTTTTTPLPVLKTPAQSKPSKTVCVCRQNESDQQLVGCTSCEESFHPACVGLTAADIAPLKGQNARLEGWQCPNCKPKADETIATGQKRSRRQRDEQLQDLAASLTTTNTAQAATTIATATATSDKEAASEPKKLRLRFHGLS